MVSIIGKDDERNRTAEINKRIRVNSDMPKSISNRRLLFILDSIEKKSFSVPEASAPKKEAERSNSGRRKSASLKNSNSRI